ncbi:MAG: PEP-CTERM sorting domain-containing protein, partial [Armatimonadota bacterium]|nr:PEP-CTERM sorting domain-containing protein [Armatimonadota bacterium]
TGRTLLAAALVLVAVSAAHALTFVNSRPALGGNDYVDWGVLGPAFTVVSNPVTLSSNGGLSVTVSKITWGPFERRDQGSGWAGNFAPSDRLLWTRNEVGPMEIEFASPVFGAGAQIQADVFGAFVGILSVYDVGNNVIGVFPLLGISTNAGDNSAIFLGVKHSSAIIKKVSFDAVTRGVHVDFAINQLDILTQGDAPVIPEPGTMLLMSIGGLAIGLSRRLRRSV